MSEKKKVISIVAGSVSFEVIDWDQIPPKSLSYTGREWTKKVFDDGTSEVESVEIVDGRVIHE